MVSSKYLNSIIQDFKKIKIDIYAYSEEISDIVFDVFSSETFIMGIAERVQEGKKSTNQQYLKILKQPLLQGNFWNNNKKINIADYPELFNYIKTLDLIRKTCLEIITS